MKMHEKKGQRNMRALLDTCVILDALENRKPFDEDAQQIILLIAGNMMEGYISATSITDIYYLYRKFTHDSVLARQSIQKLLSFMKIADITESDCLGAVFSGTQDLEDEVQMEMAKRMSLDYIITRNIKDYQGSSVPAILPSDFLKII